MIDTDAHRTDPANHGSGATDRARMLAHIRHLEALVIRLHDEAREAELTQAHRQAKLESWVAGTEARMAGIEAENAHLRDRIAELHASTSWRVTAPLRWLRQRLG